MGQQEPIRASRGVRECLQLVALGGYIVRVWFRLGGVKNTAQYRGVYPVPTDGEPPSQQCQAKRAECIANALAEKKIGGNLWGKQANICGCG